MHAGNVGAAGDSAAHPEEEPLLAKAGKGAAGKAAGPGLTNDVVYGLINAVVRAATDLCLTVSVEGAGSHKRAITLCFKWAAEL